MIRVRVCFGVGYGTHGKVLEFAEGTDPEEIEEQVSDYVRDRFWWKHDILKEGADD